MNGNGVCDDDDCGLVVNDVREGSVINERDEKSVDDECCDSEMGSVDDKCVDNASSCSSKQSDSIYRMLSDAAWMQSVL